MKGRNISLCCGIRELAFQIAEQFRVLGKSLGLKDCIVVGGMDMVEQAIQLSKRPHVIIATPGRLHDHIRSSADAVHLSRVRFLVMDEADRLLEPCFAPALQAILSRLPKKRQTLLYTATMTNEILALQNQEKRPFTYLCDMSVSTVPTLEQQYLFVPSQVRHVYLAHLLRSEDFKDKSIIIFCGRCDQAQLLTVMLIELGIDCTGLHSHMTQQQRLNSLGRFRAEVVKILISTDVGSRYVLLHKDHSRGLLTHVISSGLDIPSVEVVINYHIPRDPTEYIHRVGRTARAGRGGRALSIVSEKDIQLIQSIEERISKYIGRILKNGFANLLWYTIIDKQLEEYKINENAVLEELTEVSTAKRVASMVNTDDAYAIWIGSNVQNFYLAYPRYRETIQEAEEDQQGIKVMIIPIHHLYI